MSESSARKITYLNDDLPSIMSSEFEAGLDAEAEMLRRVEAGESVEEVFGGDPIPPRGSVE